MPAEPKVSVCLPVFNGENFLAQSIESVLEQTFTDFELIIGVDFSDDRTESIALQYAARDKRITVLSSETQLGSAGNHNRCFAASRGQYIKPAHHDDLLNRTILERMVAELDRRAHVVLVSCAREILGPGDKALSINRPFENDLEMPGMKAVLENLLTFNNYIGEPPAVMFRKESLPSAGFLKELHWYKDTQCWMEILQKGDYFYIADVLCRHRVHEQAATKRNLEELFFVADIVNLRRRYTALMEAAGYPAARLMDEAAKAAAKHLAFAEYVLKSNYFGNRAAKALSTNPGEVTEMLALLMNCINHMQKQEAELLEEKEKLQNEKLELEQSCKTLAAEKQFLEQSQKQLEIEKIEIEKQVSSILSSKSWKLTKPLRELSKRAGGKVQKSSQSNNGM